MNDLKKKLDFISLNRDTTFKYLFKNEKTRKWLEEIIYDKCHIDLSNFILVDNEANTGSKVKDYRMDLVLYNPKTKENVIIEMNGYYSKSSQIKSRKYLYRKAGTGYDKGENYNDDIKVTLISINNFYHRIHKDITTIFYTLYSKQHNLEYDDIKIHEIYLKLFHKMCYDKCSDIDKRLWLFGCESLEEMEKVLDDDNEIIIKELRRLSMNSEFIDEYDYENVQRKLMNSMHDEGYDEGFDTGYDSGLSLVASNLLKENIDIKLISKTTGLSIKDIRRLQKKHLSTF